MADSFRSRPLFAGFLLVTLSCGGGQDPQRPTQPQPGYGAPPGYAGSYPPGTYGPSPSPQQPPPPAPYPYPYPPSATPPPPSSPAPAPAPPPQSAPSTGAALPPPPLGSFDLNGSMTSSFIRQEAASVIAELVGALPEGARPKVQGIPLEIPEDPKEVNAFAGCSKTGSAFMGITAPLLLIMSKTSEARAFDEAFGTAKYNELANGIANEVKAQKPVAGPPAGFLPLPHALDPRKLSRQKFLFDEQVAFVLGHELAHHYRGHTGCAVGAATSSAVTAQDIGRLLSSAIPLFNQPNEFEADVQGTFNLLDTGARRQGGRWTEEGALMTLEFFSRLQSFGVQTVLLGFLMTHPPPQLRSPVVQNAAQQWRSGGGKAPAFPLQLPR